MGYNSHIKTWKVYRLSLSTIGTWFEKKSNISIWLPIVKSLLFKSILKSIPISPSSNSSFQNYKESIIESNRIMRGLKKYDVKLLTQTKICFLLLQILTNQFYSYYKDRNGKNVLKNRPFVIINEY